MHESCYNFVRDKVAQHALAGKQTLEIGSYDVNGSIRPLFSGPYIGLDMREGPGVDVIANSYELPFASESFEVVVSTSTLEHDRRFWDTFAEVHRVLKPGGHFVLTTTAFGWEKHEFPYDYWRFTPEALDTLSEDTGFDVLECCEPNTGVPDLVLHARRALINYP